ncbi:MAG: ThuA domain-containing protein [Verrucomicrobiota bacterium]
MKIHHTFLLPALATSAVLSVTAAAAEKPLKALLVIGGCCHDYGVQKDILEAGIEARGNIEVDVCYSPDTSTKATFACYEKDDWAAGYDVVIHDECSADIKDAKVVERILAPHRKGLPGVNLHCSMHSYRVSPEFKKPLAQGAEGALWFEFLGLQSSSHGQQKPIAISYIAADHAVTKGLENWTTGNEELYNNLRIHDSATPLAKGKQGDAETVVVWTNSYGEAKTRVFSTTLGHNNQTLSDDRYLDLVTRGLLWSCGKLGDDGKPAAGYAPAVK